MTEDAPIPLVFETASYIIYCKCGHEIRMSESVYNLVKHGNVQIKCSECKKIIKTKEVHHGVLEERQRSRRGKTA